MSQTSHTLPFESRPGGPLAVEPLPHPVRLPQVLHIFRKDVVHLLPETAVVLALFLAFAWSAPSGWTQSQYAPAAQILAAFLHILMPISWLVLISRLIHDEPLVGDRQFWISRPYHWAKLLAAKLVYLVVFLYLPFLLMQIYLLKHAGLYPTLALPALFHNLLLLTVVVIVPVTALAAVTSTFARLLLTVLGSILYLLVLVGVVGWLSWSRMQPPHLESVLIAIVILLPALALVYQYRTRRTQVARILLLATPLLTAALVLLTPAGALIRSAYPVAGGADDPKLSNLPEQLLPKGSPTGSLRVFRNQVEVTVPFAVANVDKDSNYLIRGVAATVDAPGVHWTTPYTANGGQQVNSGSPFSFVSLAMPLEVFNKIHNAPANIHLSLATEHLKQQPPTIWKATLRPFSVPGHGLCSFPSAESAESTPAVLCRYPLKVPEISFVSAPVAASSCNASPAHSVEGATTIGGQHTTLDFDPVVTIPLSFRTRDPNPQHRYVLCPGTPLSFTDARSQGNARLEVEEKQLVLDAFAARIPVATGPAAEDQGSVPPPQ